MGYHNIHDYYLDLLRSQPGTRDTIQWHFHPTSIFREAHRCATHYFRTDEVFQVLARRIIDRNFFPSCFRAGFQAERPDSHWFLEQYIPFDLSNMATQDTSDLDSSLDFRKGRSGNWRQAPSDWSVYHPSHDNYQRRGNCRRLIGRALNLRNRIGNLTQAEVDSAYALADTTRRNVLLGICSHDWRDLEEEILYAQQLFYIALQQYPNVSTKYCQATEAFREHVDNLDQNLDPLEIKIEPFFVNENDVPYIRVKTAAGKVFGPQPFLAIKTKTGRYLHDNFDFSEEAGVWFYPFYSETLNLSDVSVIAAAANDGMGRTSLTRLVID